MPSSSARTRRPLSEAMKLTVFTRGSRSTVSRKRFRNKDPLAPVVATVRFSGGRTGKAALHEANASNGLELSSIGMRSVQVQAAGDTRVGGDAACRVFGGSSQTREAAGPKTWSLMAERKRGREGKRE